MLRAACALVFALACGVAGAADLEFLPKGQPKQQPTPQSVPQAPAQQEQKPLAPQQQPSAPQQLQSPELPVDKDKPVPGDDKRLNDLQPPDAAPPGQGESWWQRVVRSAPNCRTFSDGCRTCDPGFKCSGLPIACQPKEFVCTDPKNPAQ